MAGEAQIEPPATRSTEAPKKISKEENGLCGLDQKPIGFRAALNEKRQQQHDYTTPQPWIVQKVAILLVIGLLGLSTYVYIGRVCLPMIQEATGVLGSRTLGIIYISFFCPLLLMTLWTYVKVVLTPPGFARDHCPKVPPPAPPTDAGPRYGTTREWDVDTYDESIRSWDRSPSSPGGLSPQVSRNSGDPTESSTAARKSEQPGSPTQEGTPGIMPVSPYSQGSTSNGNGQEADGSVRELDAIPGVASHHANSNLKTDGAGGVPEPLPAAARTSSSLPPPLHSRRPPRHPLLAEEYRYCSRDGFIKPMRAHHCRICATCVLNFDHHCPWIGQCVGARNRKFFVNFVFWAALYTIYTAVSLIAVNARATLRHRDIDPLQIVIIILGLLFGLFTGGLFITHTMLIMLNMTTVEQYSISSMKERERASLGQMLPWWDFGGRRRTIRKWDEEWGALQTEGNLWYLDNRRTNWEATMGKKVSWWFLPIGKSEGDGLVYPTNPRFTSDGKWRRRKDWPEELR